MREGGTGFFEGRENAEDGAAASGHEGRIGPGVPQFGNSAADFRTLSDGNRLEYVSGFRAVEVTECQGIRERRDIRVRSGIRIRRENFFRGQAAAGLNHNEREIPPAGKRIEDFADAAGAGEVPMEAERDIGAEGEAEGSKVGVCERGLPELIEAAKDRGGICAASTETGADGDVFFKTYAGTSRIAGCLFEGEGCAVGEVFFVRRKEGGAGKREGEGVRIFEGDGVRKGDRLHEHIHEVIAVGTDAGDVQGPVDFRMGFQLHDMPHLPFQN